MGTLGIYSYMALTKKNIDSNQHEWIVAIEPATEDGTKKIKALAKRIFGPDVYYKDCYVSDDISVMLGDKYVGGICYYQDTKDAASDHKGPAREFNFSDIDRLRRKLREAKRKSKMGAAVQPPGGA